MSTPSVPQRPARSQKQDAASSNPSDQPLVPPRPARSSDRSVSRDRYNSARSPLNDVNPHLRPREDTEAAPLQRTPSVASLPTVGQEGMEYASLDQPVAAPAKGAVAPQHPNETSHVSHDLPLHAPKASVPSSTAQARVAPVTRTDSSGAVKPASESGQNDSPQLKPHRPPSNAAYERPKSGTGSASIHHEDDDHGIPHIGSYVPMNPMAGDVQAPTPGGSAKPFTAGVGFFNDGSRPTTQGSGSGRRKSAQAFHNPPDSYGLHGHGVGPHDQLEKAWYQRHPDELEKDEHGAHSPALTSDWHESQMTSEELNKLVRETNTRAVGMGTAKTAIGAPTEAMGYEATGLYSKAEMEGAPLQKRVSRPGSTAHADSPLRTSTFPGDEDISPKEFKMKPPAHRVDKYTGSGYDQPTVDLGPEGGNTAELGGWIEEDGRGTPILASDETAKNPGAEYLLPAVSPSKQLTDDEYFAIEQEGNQGGRRSKSQSRPNSRTASRPTSVHGLSRFTSHDVHDGTSTPLEEIEEYEPLFEDDEDGVTKPLTTADKVKQRPTLEKHRFPSMDIWEDSPDSAYLSTTVETPEEERQISPIMAKSTSAFEHPDKEQARKGEVLETERSDFLQDEARRLSKPKFNTDLEHERTAHHRHRFPSQDIWEDTPDSANLSATLGDTEEEAAIAQRQAAAVDPTKPNIPARPTRAKQVAPTTQQPTVPARPTGSKPIIPERPKPQVPSRPVKSATGPTILPAEPSPLANTTSADGSTNVKSPPMTKPKPTVPTSSKPQSNSNSKFASIKAGFMSDLNSKLGLGPQQHKPQDEKKDADEPQAPQEPLSDARKGRARGPARRKPASSPQPAIAASASSASAANLSFSIPRTIWHIPLTGPPYPMLGLNLQEIKQPETSLSERPLASPLATNTAGERLLSRQDAPRTASGGLAHKASAAQDARARRESEAKRESLRAHEEQRIGHAGDMPSPVVEEYLPPLHAAGAPDAPAKMETPDAVGNSSKSPSAVLPDKPLTTVLSADSAAAVSEKTPEQRPTVPKLTSAEILPAGTDSPTFQPPAGANEDVEGLEAMGAGSTKGVQTGSMSIESGLAGQVKEKAEIVLGGDAKDGGDVVVKE